MNKHIPTKLITAMALASSVFASTAQAAEYSISITNLTRGIYFTPLLVTAHDPAATIFQTGEVASASLQAMAEGGDISGLVTDLTGLNATIVENPAAGLLGPGATTETTLDTGSATANSVLSIVGMMLPTNDGFVGLNSFTLPTTVGESMTVNLSGYDAGTEANDEVVGSGAPGEPGYPAPGPVGEASGENGTGVAAEVEGFVHVHRNVLGDADATGGVSDIDSTVHRWLNPVARVTITLVSE